MSSSAAVTVILVLAAVIAVARFEMFCLRDLAASRDADLQYLTRAEWLACILLAIPVGGVAYLYRGKLR